MSGRFQFFVHFSSNNSLRLSKKKIIIRVTVGTKPKISTYFSYVISSFSLHLTVSLRSYINHLKHVKKQQQQQKCTSVHGCASFFKPTLRCLEILIKHFFLCLIYHMNVFTGRLRLARTVRTCDERTQLVI